MTGPHSILINKEKNLCEYGGSFGIFLTLTCLIQHFIFAIPGPVTGPMIPAYMFSIAAFIFLALQKPISIVLLIISAALSFIIEYLWIMHYAFSLVVLLLFIYHAIIIVIVFMENIPKKLKMKKAAQKAERDMWADKI